MEPSEFDLRHESGIANDLAGADITTEGAGAGDPGFGVPDGFVTGADINYYVNLEQKIRVDTVPAASYGYGYGGWYAGSTITI